MRKPLRIVQTLAVFLAHPHAPKFAALLAVLLTLPSMRAGWIVDDHFHRAVMIAPSDAPMQFPDKLDMFRFLDGDPERNRDMMDQGFLPWWTDPEIRGAFWRPVTAITHWIDYQLWPESPALMHAHSALWYGAVVLVLGIFYRRMLGPTWVAGLATLLYAVDDARGLPVGFIANRNALIAAFFGVLVLVLHDRWRSENSKRAGAAAFIVFIISLLSSEAGLATTAYLFAYALFRDRAPLAHRIRSLVPYALIVVAWRIAWSAQGYGVSSGMGLYIDPLTEPVGYIQAALSRLPVLLAGQFAFPPADVSILLDTDYVWVHVLLACLIVIAIAATAWPVLRRTPDAAFWSTGMLLSLLPVCATFPSDRLLGFAGIGAMALIARFLEAVWSNRRSATSETETESDDVLVIAPTPSDAGAPGTMPAVAAGQAKPFAGSKVFTATNRPQRFLAAFLVVLHLIVAPAALALRSAYPSGPQHVLDQLTVNTEFDESITDKTLIIVNAPMVFYAAHVYTMRALDGLPVPRRIRSLASGMPSMTLERVDERTLLVRPEWGFVTQLFDRLFRSPQRPLRLGDRIELTGLVIEITEMTSDSRPAEARFTFDVPLEHESLAWLFWQDGAFAWWTPPAIGETVTLPCMISLTK